MASRRALCEVFKFGQFSLSPFQYIRRRVISVSMRTPKQGAGRSSDPNSSEDTVDHQSENGKSTQSSKQVDPIATKHRLLKILNALINLDSQHGRVEELILQLEGLNSKPITDTFTEMALSGKWRLVFSSMRTQTDGSIRIRQIGQLFDTERKTLTNQVLWSFPSGDGAQELLAYLWVICEYKLVGPGRLKVSITEHKIKVLDGKDGRKVVVPEDMESVITNLRRALPMDFFDPSGLLDVSYIEPNFRIARFVGKRLAGVRNVFVRVDTEG